MARRGKEFFQKIYGGPNPRRLLLGARLRPKREWGNDLPRVAASRASSTPRASRTKRIRLLRIAAEVEHALMVEYLYAAFTLRPGPGTNKYRNALVTIAKQEMGHFVTVQHLLCPVGRPSASRPR